MCRPHAVRLLHAHGCIVPWRSFFASALCGGEAGRLKTDGSDVAYRGGVADLDGSADIDRVAECYGRCDGRCIADIDGVSDGYWIANVHRIADRNGITYHRRKSRVRRMRAVCAVAALHTVATCIRIPTGCGVRERCSVAG